MPNAPRRTTIDRSSLACERLDEGPFALGHRCDRQSIAALEHDHVLELAGRMPTQLFERDHPLELAHQLHIDHVPARFIRIALRIVVLVLAVERGGIRIRLALYGGNAGDTGDVATGVIKEGEIALLHLAKIVARLEITHAVPAAGAVLGARQVIDAERGWLGLHQPVVHTLAPLL